MPRCIALFRAVNVGGRFIKMEALRAEFEARMSANVTTSIASGNVIFESRARNLVAFARKIEAHLRARFGFGIHTFIRAEDELSAVAAHEAFDPAESAVAKAQVVGLVADPLDAAAAQALGPFQHPANRFHVGKRTRCWRSTNGQDEATVSNAAFERALRTRACLSQHHHVAQTGRQVGLPLNPCEAIERPRGH